MCLTIATFLAAGCSGSDTPEPITLALLSPQTGPHQELGRSAEHGMLLAVEEANQDPIMGRPVEVRLIDSRGDAGLTQHSAVRVVKINQVTGLLGGCLQPGAEKVCRVAETYKVPHVTPVWLPVESLEPSSFTVGPAPQSQGKVLAQFARKKWTKLAVLTNSEDSTATLLTDAFLQEIDSKAVVYQSLYNPKESLDRLAGEIKKQQAEAVLIAGRTIDLTANCMCLQDVLGEQVAVLFGGNELREPALPADFVCYCTVPFAPDQPEAKAFTEKYRKRFHRSPDVAAALSYDSTKLLLQAMRQSDSIEAARVLDQLLKLEVFQAVNGSFPLKEHALERPVYVVTRTKGKLEVMLASDDD